MTDIIDPWGEFTVSKTGCIRYTDIDEPVCLSLTGVQESEALTVWDSPYIISIFVRRLDRETGSAWRNGYGSGAVLIDTIDVGHHLWLPALAAQWRHSSAYQNTYSLRRDRSIRQRNGGRYQSTWRVPSVEERDCITTLHVCGDVFPAASPELDCIKAVLDACRRDRRHMDAHETEDVLVTLGHIEDHLSLPLWCYIDAQIKKGVHREDLIRDRR